MMTPKLQNWTKCALQCSVDAKNEENSLHATGPRTPPMQKGVRAGTRACILAVVVEEENARAVPSGGLSFWVRYFRDPSSGEASSEKGTYPI